MRAPFVFQLVTLLLLSSRCSLTVLLLLRWWWWWCLKLGEKRFLLLADLCVMRQLTLQLSILRRKHIVQHNFPFFF